MLKIFTPEDLLLFHYKETNAEDSAMIKNSLLEDDDLRDEYLEMRQMIGLLNKAEKCSPSQTSIDIIMDYSGGKVLK